MNPALPLNPFLQVAVLIIAFLSSVTIHECSHALVAYFLGDDTARRFGRLSLNPFAHLDFFGLLFLLFFRIGWAKPVPIDVRNFRFPRIFSVIVGLAGPASNFLFALVLLYVAHYVPASLFPIVFTQFYTALLAAGVSINIMLGVFNLLPLPPLDGSHIIYALLPPRVQPLYYLVAQFSMVILLVLFMVPQTHVALFRAIAGMEQLLQGMVV